MANAQFEIVVLSSVFFMALPYPSYSLKFAIIMSTTLRIRSRKRFPAPKIGALKTIGEAKGSELVWVFRNVLEDCITVHPGKPLFLSPLEAGSLFSSPSVHGAGGWAQVRRPYIPTAFLTAAAAERLRNLILAVFIPLHAPEKGFDLHNLICFQTIPPGRRLVQKSREASQKRKHKAEFQGPVAWGQRDCRCR